MRELVRTLLDLGQARQASWQAQRELLGRRAGRSYRSDLVSGHFEVDAFNLESAVRGRLIFFYLKRASAMS